MLKKWVVLLVLAAATIGSSSAWTMQFDLRPEQVRKMAVNASQAKAIAAFKTVAVLAAVPDQLVVRAPRDACADIEMINDWDFRKQIEDHVGRAVSSRFTVVPMSYDGDALNRITGLGEVPRSALPAGDGVDAFVVIWGRVAFWHTAGLPVDSAMGMGAVAYYLSQYQTEHEPEFEFTDFTVDIINAKTRRTIVRKEIQPFPSFGQDNGIFEKGHWNVRGVGAKERAEGTWLCGSPLTEEKKQELKDDYQMLIQRVLDFGLPLLRLAPPPQSK